MKRLAFLLCLLAAPASADVAEVVRDHILPGYARFSEATAKLAALETCEEKPLRAAWNTAFDAWMGVAHLRLGPVEDNGRVLAIAFWPDPKGIGRRQLNAAVSAADPTILDPRHMAEQSVAMRGLFGLERLLYSEEPLAGYRCDLARSMAADLARMAKETEQGWQAGFAASLTEPGPDGRYLNKSEARQALLTVLVTGLEFNADQRIGRPLGTFDRPRPERAEARASDRTVRNIVLSLQALQQMADLLHEPIPRTDNAFTRAIAAAKALDLSHLEDPQAWLKAEIVGQSIRSARDAAMVEIAAAFGVAIGFNAADGD